MSYVAHYQKKYRKQNKERIRELQRELYNAYKSQYLPCIFCHKLIQLNAVSFHLKTMYCKQIQNGIDNQEKLLMEFKRKLNKLRAKIRFENEGIDEEIL